MAAATKTNARSASAGLPVKLRGTTAAQWRPAKNLTARRDRSTNTSSSSISRCTRRCRTFPSPRRRTTRTSARASVFASPNDGASVGFSYSNHPPTICLSAGGCNRPPSTLESTLAGCIRHPQYCRKARYHSSSTMLLSLVLRCELFFLLLKRKKDMCLGPILSSCGS